MVFAALDARRGVSDFLPVLFFQLHGWFFLVLFRATQRGVL